MKLPSKLKIGGHIYPVTIQDRLKNAGTDKLGSSNVYYEIGIWLESRQTQTQLESTLIHEILEIINSLNKLGLDEHTICVLETNLYQVLRDNNLLK